MNGSDKRAQLEQEFEQLDRQYRAALREQRAAHREAQGFAAVNALPPFESPEEPDSDAMRAAYRRREDADAEVKRLRAEQERLREQLDRI